MRNFWPKYVKCCVKLKLYSPNQHACLEKRNDSNKRQVSPEKRKISGISFITLHVRDKIILSDIRESKLRKQIECAWSMESAEEELNPKCVPKVYYDLYTVLVSILWYLNAFQWSHGMLHVPRWLVTSLSNQRNTAENCYFLNHTQLLAGRLFQRVTKQLVF